MDQHTKDRQRHNRTCVARGHLKDLQRHGKTIVKDAAVLDILCKLYQGQLTVTKIQGILRYVNRDPSSCYCCQRKLICPNVVNSLLHKGRINNVRTELTATLKVEFNREKLTRQRIGHIFDAHYTYSADGGHHGTYVRDWTYFTVHYDVRII